MNLSVQHLNPSIDSFAQNYSYNTPFENLTTLRLKLYSVPGADSNAQISLLAPFLISVHPTLQHLHIDYSSSLKLNFSPIFDDLSQFVIIPNFKTLSLSLSTTTSLLSLQSLHRFLITYHNIHHLTLRLNESSPGSNFDFDIGPLALATWLVDLADSNCLLSSLETLDIDPTQTETGLSALLALIKRTAPTLSSLTIYDRYLIPEEAHQVIDALSDKVKALSMNITNSSVSILDHLARKIPNLANLVLKICPENLDQDVLLNHRRYDRSVPSITQDPLHTWKLMKLTISMERTKNLELVSVVARAVPSLRNWVRYLRSLESQEIQRIEYYHRPFDEIGLGSGDGDEERVKDSR